MRYMVQLGPNGDRAIQAIMKAKNLPEDKVREMLEGMQIALNDMKKAPMYAQYIQQRKLHLLDSSLQDIDDLLNYKILLG